MSKGWVVSRNPGQVEGRKGRGTRRRVKEGRLSEDRGDRMEGKGEEERRGRRDRKE